MPKLTADKTSAIPEERILAELDAMREQMKSVLGDISTIEKKLRHGEFSTQALPQVEKKVKAARKTIDEEGAIIIELALGKEIENP